MNDEHSLQHANAHMHRWKWIVLFLASMVTFGGYYSFDFPSVLHNQLYRHFLTSNPSLSPSDYELSFSLLFSLYSLPNTILPWFGGILSDKIGNNTVMIVCGIFVLLGNIIQTYAIMISNLSWMVFGRFIFGLGAETLQVCTNTTISKWFNGMELAFALGINLSSCKLAGVLTDWISPEIERQGGVVTASIVATCLCLVCFVMTIVLVVYEPSTLPPVRTSTTANTNHMESLDEKTTTSTSTPSTLYYQILGLDSTTSSSSAVMRSKNCPQDYMPVSDDSIHMKVEESHWTTTQDDEVDFDEHEEGSRNRGKRKDGERPREREYDIEMMDYQNTTNEKRMRKRIDMIERGEKERERDKDKDKDISRERGRMRDSEMMHTYDHDKKNGFMSCCWKEVLIVYQEMCRLSANVWMMMVFTFLMYGTFIPFSNISNAVILEVFFANTDNLEKSEMTAAWYQSIPYFLTVFLNPVLGLMVDWFGHRTFLLIVSALSLTLAHLLIYSAALGAILPLLMIGLAYSIFGSVIWPCVPVVVEESLHGTAYGTMAAFQNTGQFIMPLVLQYIFRIEHHLFRPCELFLAFTAFSAMVCGFILYHMDRKYFDGILSKPSVIVRS